MDLSQNLITPVILCGGPASQNSGDTGAERPKHFQKLSGNLSRFQQTLLRVSDPGQFNPPMIIADQAHHNLIKFEMEMVGVECSALVLEPSSRGTAPSVALAALVAGAYNLGGSLLIMPCDHLVRDPGALTVAIQKGLIAARTGSMLAFGRKVASGDEEHAWLQRGAHLFDETTEEEDGADVYQLDKFIPKSAEKDAEFAALAQECYRNSGMYLLPIATILEELRLHVPDVLIACQLALVSGSSQGDILTPSEDKFAVAPSVSIEAAVMERTDRAGLVVTSSLWSEEGTRQEQPKCSPPAVWDEPQADNVIMREVTNSLVQSTGPVTVVAGLDDVVVVNTPDAVIVSARSHVGQLLEAHEISEEGADLHAIPAEALDMLRHAVREAADSPEAALEETMDEAAELEEAEHEEAEHEEVQEVSQTGEHIDLEPPVAEDIQPELPFDADPVPDDEAEEEPPLLLHAALESAA